MGVLNHSLIFDSFLLFFTALSIGFDVAQRRIPNWLNLAGIAGGILLSAIAGGAQLYASVLGLCAGIAIFSVPFVFGWLGAGDVKFFGAIGAIFGLTWIPRLLFYSTILGGIVALISIAFTKHFGHHLFKRTLKIPYGVAIGLGALTAFYLDPQGAFTGF